MGMRARVLAQGDEPATVAIPSAVAALPPPSPPPPHRSNRMLAMAAAVSVWFGSQLASVMSRALLQMNTALKRVERLDYVHIEPVHTGDELEALASGFNTMVDGLKEAQPVTRD